MREEAIRMALEGRQFERAADLLVMAADDLWRRGESETIRSYMKGLPGALVRQRADLALIRTRLDLVAGDWKAIEEALTDAEAALQGAPSGELAAYRSVLARVQNDLPTAVAQAEAALALLPDRPVSWGPVAAMSLAMAQILAGVFAVANESLVRLERLAQAVGDAYYAALAVYIQGELAETQGHLQYAFDTFQRAERISRTRSGLMPSAGLPRVGMGRVLLEWNRLAEAEAHIDEALRIGRATSHLDTLFRGFIAKAELRTAQGDLAGADAVLLEMDESIPAAKPPQVDLLVGVARAQIYLAQGRLEAVATWGRQCEAVAGSVPVAFDAVALTLADLAVKAGRPEQAIAHLAPILARAERLSLVGVQVRGNILLALAHQALGESAQAQAAIRRAVSLGRPEGYIQSFRGGGALLAFLLAQVRPTAPEYVDRLLAVFGGTAATAGGGAVTRPAALAQPLIEPLSERELELLGLLAEGLANQEIAERLFIAPGTVKRHVHNILGKLDASDRVEAVAKARALGLL